jgi:hypothetical protein
LQSTDEPQNQAKTEVPMPMEPGKNE